ncbi:MAG: hypothetical protein WAV40_03065 [Microgenomates group bacterium]
MAEKEKLSEVKELEKMVRSGETDAGGEDKDGLKFLEQLMVFMKLKLLRKTTETGEVKKETLDGLEKDLLGSDQDKKQKANTKLEELLKKVVGIETGIDEQPIDVLIAKAKMPSDQRDLATSLEMRVVHLKNGEYAGDKKAEAESIAKGFLQIGESVGILKTGEKTKEQIVTKLNAELAEVSEIKRRVEVVKVQGEMSTEKGAKERASAAKSKSLEFVNKELKDGDNKLTKVRLGKGADREGQKLQGEVNRLLKIVQEDMTGLTIEQHLGTKECITRLYEINRISKLVSKFDFPRELEDHLFEMQLPYMDRLKNTLQADKVTNGEQVYDFVKEIWYSKKLLNPDELNEKLHSIAGDSGRNEKKKGKKVVPADELSENNEDPLDFINKTLGLDQREKRMRGALMVEKIKDIMDANNLDIRSISNTFKGRTREEFAQAMQHNYGFDQEQANLFYDSIFSNRAAVRNETFNDFINRKDYKGYTGALISYLSKVGLREGMNDLELMSLMNSARITLAEAGPEGERLLEVFKSFESMAFFHDKYFNLGAKEYAEILNHLGDGPLWVWLQEHADVLREEITFKEGSRKGEKASISVLEFHDMMQSQYWAKRLAYTAPIRESELFDEMMYSHLLNGDEPIKIMENGDIFDMNKKLLGNKNQEVSVDGGDPIKMSVLTLDSRWKVGTAQDIWRFTGRNLNILDDINIATALGVNKGLLGISKICRYSEQYEFISSYQHEIMGADTFLYDFDWYKNTFGKGMKKLIGEAGIEPKQAELIQKIISKHIMSKRRVGEEVFDGSNLAMEDVKLLANGTKLMTFDEAKAEYLGRLAKRGEKISNIHIDPTDANDKYAMQVNLLMEKWNDNAFSAEEMAQINALPWDKINKIYAKRLGKESIGNDFSSFINNFSYARISEYVDSLRGTDMKDYGGYYAIAAEAVAGAIKAGLSNGSSEALAKMIGAMETYHPYDANGLNRLGMAMWEQILTWRTHKLTRRVPVKSGGYILPNGDLMVNKYGRWEKEMKTEVFFPGESLMSRYKYLETWGFEDVEMSMRFLVGKGIFTRKDGDAILKRKYGNALWRWIRRSIQLNDWEYFWIQLEKDGNKELQSIFKYVFSAK